jgi:hypothetical protein
MNSVASTRPERYRRLAHAQKHGPHGGEDLVDCIVPPGLRIDPARVWAD